MTKPKANTSKAEKQEIDTEMSVEISLSVLTKFIKTYNGDKETLPAFLTNCDNAMSLASTNQQLVLCKFILSQLEGKAQVACSLKNFNSWEEIKCFLKSTFGEKKHSTHLLVDLQNCKQLPSEDVTKFSLRIESILTRIQSDIHHSCKEQNELPGRVAAMEDLALNTFLLGLNASISNIVRCRNPSSLNEAVSLAIEEEKIYNLKFSSSRSSYKQCSSCNKPGHTSSECYRNRNSQRTSHPQRTFHVNPAASTSQNSQNSQPKQCNYCKNFGHTIQECRKLKFRNSQNGNAPRFNATQRPNFSQNSNVHFSTEENADSLNNQ